MRLLLIIGGCAVVGVVASVSLVFHRRAVARAVAHDRVITRLARLLEQDAMKDAA